MFHAYICSHYNDNGSIVHTLSVDEGLSKDRLQRGLASHHQVNLTYFYPKNLSILILLQNSPTYP